MGTDYSNPIGTLHLVSNSNELLSLLEEDKYVKYIFNVWTVAKDIGLKNKL